MGNFDPARRSFFRGHKRVKIGMFPPWASNDFADLCNRCGDCLTACEEQILKVGDGGYPEVDFALGECSFCKRCTEICKQGAFSPLQEKPWALKARIKPECLPLSGTVCRSCADICEVSAIRFTLSACPPPRIDDALCTGCGACYATCPVQAIEITQPQEIAA